MGQGNTSSKVVEKRVPFKETKGVSRIVVGKARELMEAKGVWNF